MSGHDDDLIELDDPYADIPKGRESAAQAALLFRDGLDLPLPPLPRQFVDEMQILGESYVGTRSDAPPLDDIEALLTELAHGRATDYVLMGKAGHGIVSGTVCCHLVLGRLAVFLELRLNALGTDWAVMRRRIVQAFEQVEYLIERRAALGEGGLVVVETDIGESRIGRFGADGKLELHADPAPLLTATRQLRDAA